MEYCLIKQEQQPEETDSNSDNNFLTDQKLINIKFENVDNNIINLPNYSEQGAIIKEELHIWDEDLTLDEVDNISSESGKPQISKSTIKPDPESEHTRLNIDATRYICYVYCSECDNAVDFKKIQNMKNCPNCGCKLTYRYQCTRCDVCYTGKQSIQKHLIIKSKCKSQRRFLNLEEFNKKWKSLNCPKCYKLMQNIHELIKHINTCEKDPQFWCSFCDYGTEWVICLERHKEVHALENGCSKKKFRSLKHDYTNKSIFNKNIICYCSKCKKEFKCDGSKHCYRCESPYTYKCSMCKKDGLTLIKAKYHIKNACSTLKKFACSVCKRKRFSSLLDLKKHMSHCEIKSYIFDCKFCSFKTKYRRGLLRHLRRHCNKDPEFIKKFESTDVLIQPDDNVTLSTNSNSLYDIFCEHCNVLKKNAEFKNKYNYCLKCKDILVAQCKKCAGKYQTPRGIFAHIKTNCGLEKKACDKCQRTFKNLKSHRIHCRNMCCAHCSYNTWNRSNLIKHLYIHREKK